MKSGLWVGEEDSSPVQDLGTIMIFQSERFLKGPLHIEWALNVQRWCQSRNPQLYGRTIISSNLKGPCGHWFYADFKVSQARTNVVGAESNFLCLQGFFFLLPQPLGMGPKKVLAYIRKSNSLKWEESPHTQEESPHKWKMSPHKHEDVTYPGFEPGTAR